VASHIEWLNWTGDFKLCSPTASDKNEVMDYMREHGYEGDQDISGITIRSTTVQKAAAWLLGILLLTLIGVVGWMGRDVVTELRSLRIEVKEELAPIRTDINELKARMGALEVTIVGAEIPTMRDKIQLLEIFRATMENTALTRNDPFVVDLVRRLRELENNHAPGN